MSAVKKINKKRTELIERLSALEKFFNIRMRILQIERACKFPKNHLKVVVMKREGVGRLASGHSTKTFGPWRSMSFAF